MPCNIKVLLLQNITISHFSDCKAHIFLYFNISEIESQNGKKPNKPLTLCLGEWEGYSWVDRVLCKHTTVIVYAWLYYRN